jgi:hypothetical protein
MPKDNTPLMNPYLTPSGGHDHGPVGSDVYYARHKLLLVNAKDPQDRLEALFNPQQLAPSVTVVAGRLHPVGWSHPIKQYAYTNELSFTLALVFTRLAMLSPGEGFGARRHVLSSEFGHDGGRGEVAAPVGWLMSFCYGLQKGTAPSPIYVIWPRTMNLLCTVDSVTPTYKRWAPDGTPVEVSVAVKFSELRKTFKSSQRQSYFGLQDPDRAAVGTVQMAGAPAASNKKAHDHG